jgi:hypothetical protein
VHGRCAVKALGLFPKSERAEPIAVILVVAVF